MTPHRLDPVLRHLRNLGGNRAADLPDAALLARFVANGDEDAFAVIVRRHGPMVLGVCRRLLGDMHSAEDAFQATFLLLVKKARWLRQPDRLGPWLYGVARRIALKARSAANRRREVASVDAPAAVPPESLDLRPVLDAAIARLPDRYRVPVVMCYLQGLTYAEAASRLRCPAGTVATRLSRAKDRLRVLLIRQGVAPAAGALTAALTPEATATIVPTELMRSTVRWATALVAGSAAAIPTSIITLTRKVAQTMILEKLKVLAVVAVLGLAGTGAGVALSRPAGADATAKPDAAPVAKADAAPNPAPGGLRTLPLVLLRQEPPKTYLLDAGDTLGVFVESVFGGKDAGPPIINLPSQSALPPAVGYPVVVEDDGTLALPYLKPLPVRGKSVGDVRERIRAAYVDGGLIRGPERIMVSLAKPRSYRVTVVSEAAGPGGTWQTRLTALDLPAYENDVLTALARSGGLPEIPFDDFTTWVTIQRGSAATGKAIGTVIGTGGNRGIYDGIQEIKIPLVVRADQPLPFKAQDVILKNGDVLRVETNTYSRSAPVPAERPIAMTLAVAAPDGRILVQIPGGAWRMFDAGKVTATETDGKPVAAVAERLKAMTAVLVAADGKPPTEQYLQSVKPGTLVLVIKD